MSIMKLKLLFLKTTKYFMQILPKVIKITNNTIRSVYFENQCFSVFTACCYTKSTNNFDVRNYNVIVVSESSDHNSVASMSCLQKVVHQIKYIHMQEKTYDNVYVWTDGIGS